LYVYITDLNECEYIQFCDQPSECTDKDPGFECACIPGYLQNGTHCTAINGKLISACTPSVSFYEYIGNSFPLLLLWVITFFCDFNISSYMYLYLCVVCL